MGAKVRYKPIIVKFAPDVRHKSMKGETDYFTILPEDKVPERGKILISEPFLADTFFNRTIVYLVGHSEEGSIGFILNKPLEIKLNEAVDGFDRCGDYLYMGGPVMPDTLHFIHSCGDNIPDSVWVDDNIYWGGDIDVVRELIANGELDGGRIRFFLGYSGWDSGQLERELEEDSWVVVKVNPEIILDNSIEDPWKTVLRGFNKKYRVWADFPKSPELN